VILISLALLLITAPAHAATYSSFEKSEEVAPVAPDVSTLPDKLVVDPGFYIVRGQPYDMRKEGVYRFSGEQRIVYKDSLDTFMSSLTWVMRHGSADNGLKPDEAVQTAMKRNLVMTCGYQVEVARHLLKGLGYKARAAALINNPYNASHTLIEVEHAGRWELWDLDYNAQPITDGQTTTIVDWVYDTDRSARVIARDERVLTTPLSASYSSYLHVPMLSSHLKTWPYAYTDPADRAKMSALSGGYRYMAPTQFYSQFYPNQSVTHP
jgi:hypothetical protein